MYKEFNYHKAASLQQVFELTQRSGNALIYAGGTDILVKLRALKLSPSMLIDVKEIPELKEIREDDKEMILGAALTHSQIQQSDSVRQWYPALCDGVGHVGSVPIRNKATLAGNIQNASPAGDGLVAALGLDAVVIAAAPQGNRRIPLCEYFTGPGKTLLGKDEIITGIALPKRRWTYQRFFKVGRRNALAISVINGLVALELTDAGTVADCRIAIGAAAPVAKRLLEAETLLKGSPLSDAAIAACADSVKSSISPISDIRASAEYRKYIAGVQVAKSLQECRESNA